MSNSLQQFVDLETRKRQLEVDLKGVEDAMKELEAVILDEWTQNGQTGAKVGGYTLYVNRTLTGRLAEGKVGQDAAAALAEAGLPWLVTANWQTVAAYIRELDAEGEPLPAALRGVIEPYERFSLRARKA